METLTMQRTSWPTRVLSRAANPRPVAILVGCGALVGPVAGVAAERLEGPVPGCVGPDRVLRWAPTGACGR